MWSWTSRSKPAVDWWLRLSLRPAEWPPVSPRARLQVSTAEHRRWRAAKWQRSTESPLRVVLQGREQRRLEFATGEQALWKEWSKKRWRASFPAERSLERSPGRRRRRQSTPRRQALDVRIGGASSGPPARCKLRRTWDRSSESPRAEPELGREYRNDSTNSARSKAGKGLGPVGEGRRSSVLLFPQRELADRIRTGPSGCMQADQGAGQTTTGKERLWSDSATGWCI